MADRGYSVLLTYLHRPTASTPALSTIQGLIAHYLATLKPYPTPLAAAIVSSPLFAPFSHSKLQALSTSFRHAVHTKTHSLKSESSSIFSPSTSRQLEDWCTAVIKGLEGGHAITRLACCAGLLLGIEDIASAFSSHMKASVQDDLVLTFADVIDVFSASGPWENEFQPLTEGGEDALSLSMVIASQSLLLVPPVKFSALPLPLLLSLITRTIDHAFRSGSFMETLQSSVDRRPDGKLFIPKSAPINNTINSIRSSAVMSSMGSLAKLCNRTLSLYVDHRPGLAISQALDTFTVLEQLSARVENDWSSSILSGITSDSSIAPETQELMTSLWTVLKTLLFTIIMVTEGALSAVVFVPPSLSHASPHHDAPRESAKVSPGPRASHSRSRSHPGLDSASPSTLALATLRTLFHLSFVIAQFGGAGHGAFAELKKTFYLALDILATDTRASEQFARELCDSCRVFPPNEPSQLPLSQAKKSFALAVIEQLVPVLGTACIQDLVLPMCLPHLYTPLHRETYESAHSVVLAIFSAHAQTISQGLHPSPGTDSQSREGTKTNHAGDAPGPLGTGTGFPDSLVPFYTDCLLENSGEGRLSTAQLRLAFAALVRSASTSGGPALARFCIDKLLDIIRAAAASAPPDDDRLRRLHLTLISSVSALPLSLLPHALDAVEAVLQSESDPGRRRELVEALFGEIMERVGDREKAYALRWWSEHRAGWLPSEDRGGGREGWWRTWWDRRSEEEKKAVARL
ncbi:hypothetical protein BJ138DRAFT_1172912 [Hygrophoropsis aurantiaca]|uniref:Uncharacterized protein n=1 Tax=Hygrophoropsis aurantiaca TaxID=72124 RepID=A0ACB8ADU7_9AGAM|nr:hypothetical protein BJ138DRAFT_1172912 [Hygrophoropsis aurantiaca]